MAVKRIFFSLLLLMITGFARAEAAAPSSVADFRKFYPNADVQVTHFLNGYNYTGQDPTWAVLWFGDFQSKGKYKMYNSDPHSPTAQCHWDQFRWYSDKLVYSQTRNTCGNDTNIVYSSGITYLPRTWDGSYWTQSGSTPANYYEYGALRCSGVNNWTAEIFATPVELAPGVLATHVRNTQTTTWDSGPGSPSTGCGPGETSNYQENLYFVTDLPIYGSQSVEEGLKRSVGGSLDFYPERGWDWDVWFDNWKQL